jgi:threonine dehydrogenase-like Zn-dependent dehydrogenase
LLDARPQLGDRVLVMGQGIVGLLVTQILAQFPLAELCVVDPLAQRRRLAETIGATASFDPNDEADQTRLRQLLQPNETAGADIVFELSGVPTALNQALALCAFSGRLVVGSWYGSKTAELALGERFHRNRIELISSQVSSIAPALSGRWDKARRFEVAWDMIRKCQPEQFISHRPSLEKAAEAYAMLDEGNEDVMQIVFDYQQE